MGALRAQTGHLGCVRQCPALFNQCPTHLEPLEVPMYENGHHWQNMAIFGASGAPRCHFLGALRSQTGHLGCVSQCQASFNQCPTHLEPLEVPMYENGHHWQNMALFGASGAPRCHFLGAQIGHPGCVRQCLTWFNQCPTHLESLEVPMCKNGHHWQNMALFGASGASRCHFLGALRAQTGHPGCV